MCIVNKYIANSGTKTFAQKFTKDSMQQAKMRLYASSILTKTTFNVHTCTINFKIMYKRLVLVHFVIVIQIDGGTDRHSDRQIDRQTDSYTYAYIYYIYIIYIIYVVFILYMIYIIYWFYKDMIYGKWF